MEYALNLIVGTFIMPLIDLNFARFRPWVALPSLIAASAILWGTTFWGTARAACIADDKQEMASIGDLLTILEGDDPISDDEVDQLLAAIPDASNLKPFAEQTVALIHIRAKNYSKAWKDLTLPRAPAPLPEELKISCERLKLWLLLEADAAGKAEDQYKRLVTAVAEKNSTAIEQSAACAFLGGVNGMLQANNGASMIQPNTIKKARDFLQKTDIKNVAALWDEQENEASQWGKDLVAIADEFKSLGKEKAEELNAATQAENERVQKEQIALRGDLKSASSGKKELDENRRKAIKSKNAVLQEMKKATPGKPTMPRPPGPEPRQPEAPRGRNQVDPNTQAAKYIPPTAQETNRFQDEMRTFQERSRNWQQLRITFERESREYSTKLENWQKQDAERRANLQAQVQTAEDAIAAAEKAMKDLQGEIKEGVAKELKETADQSEILSRKALISDIAFSCVFSNDPKSQRVVRPANFPLIDYEEESTRIRKAMR